jgi:hypothetical protein
MSRLPSVYILTHINATRLKCIAFHFLLYFYCSPLQKGEVVVLFTPLFSIFHSPLKKRYCPEAIKNMVKNLRVVREYGNPQKLYINPKLG